MDDAKPKKKAKKDEETHTEGAKERKVAAVACDSCRRSKVRCDGELPCVRCTKYGALCSYSRLKKPPPTATATAIASDALLSSESPGELATSSPPNFMAQASAMLAHAMGNHPDLQNVKINAKESLISTTSLILAIMNVHESKIRTFFNTSEPVNIFSPQETDQGKLQTYSMLSMFFRRENYIASSERFLMSAINVSRSLYDDVGTNTSFSSAFGFWLLSFACANVEVKKARHLISLAKNTALSATDCNPLQASFKGIIIKSGQALELDRIAVRTKFLNPLMHVLEPWLECDFKNIDFGDVTFLQSLGCQDAFLEACRIVLWENGIPVADGEPFTPQNLQFSMVFSPFVAQEIIQYYCSRMFDLFQDWRPDLGLVAVDEIPKPIALSLSVFCALMDQESERVYNGIMNSEMELSFFRFVLYQSLGNIEGAKRMAARSMERLRLWNDDFELVPVYKLVYPALVLGIFLMKYQMFESGYHAMLVAQQFADRYPLAARAVRMLEDARALASPPPLPLPFPRKRLLSSSGSSETSSDSTPLLLESPFSSPPETFAPDQGPNVLPEGDTFSKAQDFNDSFLVTADESQTPFWDIGGNPTDTFDFN